MPYMSCLIPQCAKAKIASPTTFTAANIKVKFGEPAFPQSETSSVIKRPRVPMPTRIKPLNLITLLIDILLGSYCLNGGYYYEDRLSTGTEKNLAEADI